MNRRVFLPASLLAGTIIGAGVFALPFVFQKAGIFTGLFYLLFFAVCFTIVHLMYADVILKTGINHRFPGYAKIYLGSWGFWSSVLMTIVGMIFVLTIYLVLSKSFFGLLSPLGSGIPDVFKLLFFWLLGSAAIFMQLRRMAFMEFMITGGIAAIILVIFFYSLGHFGRIASVPVFNLENIFLPYGAILFALSGRVAIPALVDYLRKSERPVAKVKKSIILGTLVPALIYLFFIFGIIALSGSVSQDAVSGLIGRIPNGILNIIGILGLISLWSSYIVIGLDVKSALKFDMKFSGILAGLAVTILPLALYFLGFSNFLKLVGMVGGIFIALEGIFVSLMWLKSSRLKPGRIIFRKLSPLIVYFLMIIFIGGIIYEIIY